MYRALVLATSNEERQVLDVTLNDVTCSFLPLRLTHKIRKIPMRENDSKRKEERARNEERDGSSPIGAVPITLTLIQSTSSTNITVQQVTSYYI